MTSLRIATFTLAVVIVGAMALRLGARSGDSNPVASVNNGAARGFLALRLLLEGRQQRVVVRHNDAPLPIGALVVMPPPEASAPSTEEVNALLAHVEAGGHLLIVCDDGDARNRRLAVLLNRVGIACEAEQVAFGDTSQSHARALVRAFEDDVVVQGLGRAQPLAGQPVVPLMMLGAQPFAVGRVWGAGTVVVLGSATSLANDGISVGDNAAFFMARAGAYNTVVFDERFHVGRATSVFALANSRGPGPMTAAVLLALLVPLSLLALLPRPGDAPAHDAPHGPPAAAARVRALVALAARAQRRRRF